MVRAEVLPVRGTVGGVCAREVDFFGAVLGAICEMCWFGVVRESYWFLAGVFWMARRAAARVSGRMLLRQS